MNLKILIAEDDRHTRRILEHIFTKDPSFAGKQVELFLAPDGEEALKIFEKESPHLVISDLLMPKLDGFALCRAIRKTPHGKTVPLIVTSAIYKETALLNRMREELNVEFFAKPFQVRELLRGVQNMLEQVEGSANENLVKPVPEKSIVLPKTGSLKTLHLADLILTALENKLTGTLSLKRGRIKKEIFFILGNPIGAESNVRNETMGHYLTVKRILDHSQLEKLLATARQNNLSIMQALVKIGWLSEDVVFRHHTALVKLRIINSLRWSDGTFSFKEGDDFSEKMPRCAIEPVTILLLGLKRVLDLDESNEFLNKKMEMPLELTLRGERYKDVFIKVFGEKILNHLPRHPSVKDLIAKGLNSMMTYTHVMTLLKTGMISFGKQPRQLSSAAVPSQDPLALEHLKNEAAQPSKPPSKEDSDNVIYQEIFGVDEISVVTSMPSQPMAEKESSGVLQIPLADEEHKDNRTKAESIRRLVVSMYLGIHTKNYYEIFEVSPNSKKETIEEAYKKLKDLLTVDKYSNIDLGTDHSKLEELLQIIDHAYQTLSDSSLREEYDKTLQKQSRKKKSDPLEAELFFREGELKLKQEKFKQAEDSFKKAVQIDSESPDYLAHLAWAQYKGSEKTQKTFEDFRKKLHQALEMNPDLISANFFSGVLQRDQGKAMEALSFFEKVLTQDPSHKKSFISLYEILADKGDWRVLERYHRKILHQLGNRFPERALELWKSLADIYENKLENLHNAKTCLEIALELSPGNEKISEKLKRISRPQNITWKVFRDKLLASWDTPSNRSEQIEGLFKTTAEKQLHDVAFVSSSCLAALGVSSASSSYYRRYRPPFLQRARRITDDFIWDRIRHEDDDPQIEKLFSIFSKMPMTIIDSTSLIQKPPEETLEQDENTATFFKVLEYLCEEVSITPPQVFIINQESSSSVIIHSPINSYLGVTRKVSQSSDELFLASVLAPKIPYFVAGRSFAGAMPSSSLKTFLMGSMLLVAPKLKFQDPDGKIKKISKQLSHIPQDLKKELSSLLMSLTRERSSLNLGKWTKGVKKTSCRWALLMVGDLVPLTEQFSASDKEDALPSLVKYALSDKHMEARRHLGISVDV